MISPTERGGTPSVLWPRAPRRPINWLIIRAAQPLTVLRGAGHAARPPPRPRALRCPPTGRAQGCTTSAPCACSSRRISLIAPSRASTRLAAVTSRTGFTETCSSDGARGRHATPHHGPIGGGRGRGSGCSVNRSDVCTSTVIAGRGQRDGERDFPRRPERPSTSNHPPSVRAFSKPRSRRVRLGASLRFGHLGTPNSKIQCYARSDHWTIGSRAHDRK